MSYTELSSPPGDIEFRAWNGQLVITYTCPRCGSRQEQAVDVRTLRRREGFTAECLSPKCTGPYERIGYTLSMRMSWRASMIGTNDRPLHD